MVHEPLQCAKRCLDDGHSLSHPIWCRASVGLIQRVLVNLLIDRKVPRPLRDEIPLLVSGSTILWVAGLRTAQPASVTRRTSRVLRVAFKGGCIGRAVYPSVQKR